MAGGNKVYYWDSCLFLAWLKDEERKSGEMDGVRDVISRVKRREVEVVTSVLTSVEVLSASIPAGIQDLFTGMLKRTTQVSVDRRIAGLGHDIRNYYKSRGGKTLSTPDALHVATAILLRVDEFHTFDENDRAGSLGLLPLSGNVGGHNLIITKPIARQPSLDLKKP